MGLLKSIDANYWTQFSINDKDIEYIYDLLLEKEIPLSTEELIKSLIKQRIEIEKKNSKKSSQNGNQIYFPRENYNKGDTLLFTAFDMKKGQIQEIRDGFNPDYKGLKVINVIFDSGEQRSFASNLNDHELNHIFDIPDDDPNFNPEIVFSNHRHSLTDCLELALTRNEDLVKIAGNWFPRSLLVDVHIGHLNLAEAVLEEAKGGPIETIPLMKQAELNANADTRLLEFSFDLALQEDSRFDEVGPAGKTLWFLNAMEPECVKKVPIYLQYDIKDDKPISESDILELFEGNMYDELETWDSLGDEKDTAIISLTFPHWRAGTLPLSNTLKKMFPTAYEAPRVKFTFVDVKSKEKLPGWVVREHKYVYGLSNWYEKYNLMPGSLVTVEKGEIPGEINIHIEKSRQNKEWIKTVLVGSDQAVVFAMLKQSISANFNERMAIEISDPEALDVLWQEKVYQKESIESTIIRIMKEISKLNPQGQVHAQELYAAVNVVRRCPPSVIIHNLLQTEAVEDLGNLYFKYLKSGI
jgi:hypothetical protein